MKKNKMTPLLLRMPPELEQALCVASSKTHISKTEIVRMALSRYLAELYGWIDLGCGVGDANAKE